MPRPQVIVELDADGSGLFATDISAYVDLRAGISITRGRADESADVEPSTCGLTLDNSSGVFSYGASLVRNLLLNGSFEKPLVAGSADGWSDSNAFVLRERTTTQSRIGSASLMLTVVTFGGSTSIRALSSVVSGIVAGQPYTLSGWMKAGTTPRDLNVSIDWNTGAPTVLPTMSENGTSWTYFAVTGVAPAGSTLALISVGPVAAVVAGEKHYVDGLMFEAGNVAHPYFDGPTPFTISLDMPIRVSVIRAPGNAATRRFTGYVTTWPVAWPGGHRMSVATITASDRLAKLSRRRFRSVIEQTTLETKPRQYFVLKEAEGSTTVGDTAGYSGPALSVQQRGTGGTLEMGAGTGPAHDNHSAPIFTRLAEFDGKYLGGPGLGESLAPNWSVRAVVASTAVGEQTFVRIDAPIRGTAIRFEIACNASGHLVARMGTYWSLVHAVNMCTGDTQDIVVTSDANFITVYRNGVAVASGQQAGYPFITERISIGGGPLAGYQGGDPVPQSIATISHVAIWDKAVTLTDAQRMRQGIDTGYATDSSSERIARYALWSGMTTAEQDLEAGNLVDVAHLDTDGVSPVEAMRQVALSDGGLIFIDGSGKLAFHARSHRYGQTTAVTLTAPDVGTDAQFTLDTQGLVNLVTAQRVDGATQTVRNDASIALYDEFAEDLTLLVLRDEEALQAASWRAITRAFPSARLGALTVDLLTQTITLAGAVQALSIGDVIALAGLPSQAPVSAARLFVEGWSETISTAEWSQTFNTSPLNVVAWQLEHPDYGAIDAMNRIVY